MKKKTSTMECSKKIDIEIKGKPYSLPNSWDALSPDEFVYLSGLLQDYAAGLLSVSDVRLRFVVYVLDIDMSYVPARHKDTIAQNLYILMSKITFIFNIKYPDQLWNGLSAELRKEALKTEPKYLPDTPEVRLLRRCDYKYVIDGCFAAQLLPTITIGKVSCVGYTINTLCDQLSTSLTARQYVDATECLNGIEKNRSLLPLLAATLYQPAGYSSEWAHDNVSLFAELPVAVLEAVALCFQAFVLFLFTKTHFSILWKKTNTKDLQRNKLSVGLKDGIYTLSEDGYGDIHTVGEMSLIEYLEILRKKKIDAVRTMHSAEMKITDIAEKTGLDFDTIQKII
ncbi:MULTISPECIES: hypothetical protein [Dysgonomonas]|uniref:hypothetical protein n=2 Tax=Dysgonomonadaceae TaxID=2005520 RepID=UPI00092A5833|nr:MULTISPECIES: hypothetical protein [Dysgonomonas]MBN9301630.1 hypothetical protein [Dysgonomonas mossii]OJX64412.1 MAG: hypothetical protein BGO84_10155 [Dysgonomonas sp. 37-18]